MVINKSERALYTNSVLKLNFKPSKSFPRRVHSLMAKSFFSSKYKYPTTCSLLAHLTSMGLMELSKHSLCWRVRVPNALRVSLVLLDFNFPVRMVNKTQCCFGKPTVQTEGYPKETPLFIPKALCTRQQLKNPVTNFLKNEQTQKGPLQIFYFKFLRGSKHIKHLSLVIMGIDCIS